jgi:uncharacterized protein
MSQTLLVWWSGSFLLGLAGGVHCVGMCGALCAGCVQKNGPQQFLLGRALSYIGLGALAGGFTELIAQAAFAMKALQSWVSVGLVLVAAHGGLMMLTGRGVLSLGTTAGGVQTIKASALKRGSVLLGASLPVLPCGLLASALAQASLGASWLAGAVSMASFVAGSSLWLGAMTWLNRRAAGAEGLAWRWQIQKRLRQLAGASSAAIALWVLWRGGARGGWLC